MRVLIVIAFGLITVAFLTCSCATVPREQPSDKQIIERERQRTVWVGVGQSLTQSLLNMGVARYGNSGDTVGQK